MTELFCQTVEMVGIEIRKMTVSDGGAVEALIAKAFAGLNPVGIAERELELAPETCWVAVADESVTGVVCAVQYDLLAYIGPMAVMPEYQGNGIGRRLFERLVESLEAQGCLTMMLDATEAGAPLYRKFGFVEWARTCEMTRAPGAGLAQRPVADLETVLEMDRRVFTANRAMMFRRLLEREGAALFSHSTGYVMAQAKVLGPFVAWDRGGAERLLDLAIDAGAVASRVLAPVENKEAEPLLRSWGFEAQREVKQMRRGLTVEIRRDLMYGLASFALG